MPSSNPACRHAQSCPTLLQSHGLYIACQPPLSMEFPRQEYWSGLPFPLLGDLTKSGIEPTSLGSPALAGGFFTWEAVRPSLKL